MFMNVSLDSGNLNDLTDSQKKLLRELKLSAKQLAVLDRYCQLINLNEISDSEAGELASIWQKAEVDEILSEALALLDDQQVKCLKEANLFADDNDLRAALSERVPVLAELKLKYLQGHREEIDPEATHVIMLCPDGSGYIQRPIPQEGFLSLDEICGNCNMEFSKHQHIILKGGAVPAGK